LPGPPPRPADIGALIASLPRHNSFRYITCRSLGDEYFTAAHDALEDPHVYIVLSNTGSPAGRVIGFFTGAAYTHVSLAFDSSLKTLVSYNGGGKISSPGLNRETPADLTRNPGASLAVLRLKTTAAQKQALVNRVAAINREGSSYNLLGLLTKKSALPNIMFCSQFVYTLLDDAGAAYFSGKNGRVRPMDFLSRRGEKGPEYMGGLPSGPPEAAVRLPLFQQLKTLDSRSITAYNLI
jgi:hypothetical protein